MTVPDYISPVVGYRVWQWDDAGLKSLNGELWVASRALTASCRVFGSRALFAGKKAVPTHDAPKVDCTCGLYASKSLDHLRKAGYDRFGIHGEVFLWGTVVEHTGGFRAQFAYPKSFLLPLEMMPVSMSVTEARLQTLAAYGCDINLFDQEGTVPLWVKGSGYVRRGLDRLLWRSEDWYAHRRQERRIKPGDRVAMLGRGLAVVEQVDGDLVHALLWSRERVRLLRWEVVWDDINFRWEAGSQ